VKQKKPRNYAATESTLINLRALKKRVAALEQAVKALQAKFTVASRVTVPEDES